MKLLKGDEVKIPFKDKYGETEKIRTKSYSKRKCPYCGNYTKKYEPCECCGAPPYNIEYQYINGLGPVIIYYNPITTPIKKVIAKIRKRNYP